MEGEKHRITKIVGGLPLVEAEGETYRWRMSGEIQRNEASETLRTLHYWISPTPGAFIKWRRRRWMDGERK